MNEMTVVQVPVTKIKASEYNPRFWSPAATEQLKESIRRFGMVDPVILNSAKGRENILIGGHFRVHVAKELGIMKVPAVYMQIPDLEKERELNLRLNKNQGIFDLELLKNFDLDQLLDVGFDDGDLAGIWDQYSAEDDGFDAGKRAWEIETPTVQTGELYRLGRHFLLCGDSNDPVQVERLMQGNKASMVYCDPPYNIGLNYSKGVNTTGKYGGEETDVKSEELYRDFLKKTLENAISVSSDDTHMFYWCDERYIGILQSLYEELGITGRRVCLWIKNGFNPVPHIAFNKAFEPCVYGTRGKPYLSERHTNFSEILNKEIDPGNRCLDDILDLFNIWLVRRLPGQDYLHPTEKSITLHQKPLSRCTKPGDIVLDLFSGSSSVLMACEQMERRCFACEKDPVFCQVGLDRYFELTGIKPELLT
jgi:DNA modification methylase